MLGLLLLYFIGKKFYALAGLLGKHKWLYSILSAVCYFVVGFILSGLVIILDLMVFEWNFNWEASWGMSYISVPFGLLGVLIFYNFLKNSWERFEILVKDDLQDMGKSDMGFSPSLFQFR